MHLLVKESYVTCDLHGSVVTHCVPLCLQEIKEYPGGSSFSYFWPLVIYHVSFFIFITTIGLNIIFGIIVDTFSELRDLKVSSNNTIYIYNTNNNNNNNQILSCSSRWKSAAKTTRNNYAMKSLIMCSYKNNR